MSNTSGTKVFVAFFRVPQKDSAVTDVFSNSLLQYFFTLRFAQACNLENAVDLTNQPYLVVLVREALIMVITL